MEKVSKLLGHEPRNDGAEDRENACSFSTSMFLDSLLKYKGDARQFNANVRFNLIHRPLSDCFVVCNEQQFTDRPGVVAGRAVIVKCTHRPSF